MIHTEMQELVRRSVRDFALKEVAPLAAQIDETGDFPQELYQKLARNNYFGITIPREYGGVDAGYVVMAIVMEELARVCVHHAACYNSEYAPRHSVGALRHGGAEAEVSRAAGKRRKAGRLRPHRA